MTDASFFDVSADTHAEAKAEPRRRAASWALMGDIVSHRAGVPEHLLQWCRATGEDDPDPML